MSDPRDPPDLQRSARGGTLHQGASDIGLLGPTPLAFGVAGAIALSISTEAGAAEAPSGDVRTTAFVSDHADGAHADGTVAENVGPTGVEPTAPANLQPMSTVTGGSPSIGVDASIALAIHGSSVPVAPFGNAAHHGMMPAAKADAQSQAVASTSATPLGSTGVEADEAVNAVRASAHALTDALETLVARLDAPAQHALTEASATIHGLSEALDTQIGELPAQIEDVLASTGARAEDLVASAQDTVGSIGDSLESTLSDVSTQTAALLDGASGLADNLLEGVGTSLTSTTDMAASAVQTVSGVAEATTEAAGQIITDVTQSASQNLSDLVDDVGSPAGLSGDDPLGGLVTLAGLVDASESFEIVRESDALPIFASVTAVPDLLSSVGDVEAADPGTVDDGLIDTTLDTVSQMIGGDKHGLGGLFDGDHDHG